MKNPTKYTMAIALIMTAFAMHAISQTQVDTFYYTGSDQMFVVPTCSGPVTVDVRAGKGGDEYTASGGLGGRVQGGITLNPGDTLYLIVGRAGLDNMQSASGVYFGSGGVYSYNSCGVSGTGGGASDIRLNGNTLSDRIVVAGGGGGAGGINYQALYGGAGGGLTGGDGLNWNTWPNAGGKGGTQTAGGAAGIACCSCPTYTTAGSLGQGGNGSGDCAGGGGGGGGYYGGGGACFSGGGGGSSYTDTIVYNVVHTQGYQNGDGMIILTYDPNAPIQTQDTTAACDSFFVQGAYQTSSGVYQDSLTSINGCDSIVAVALTINNSAFTSLSESSCDSFYVQGAYQTSSGLYYDTLQTLSGCDSIIETDLTVTNIDTAVTQNDTVLSANMAGATYQWVDCDSSYALMQGDTDQVYYPNANGNYAVIITLNGCTDTSGCHRVKTIGMSEITGSTSVFVYPNPATSSFTVEGNFSLPITLILYDLTGRQALEKELHGNRQQVDIRQLSKGMYLLQLSNAAGTTTRKLIIR